MTKEMILSYVENFRKDNNINHGAVLTKSEIITLVKGIQLRTRLLSFKPPSEESTLILYNGKWGDIFAYNIVDYVTKNSEGKYYYISDTEAGKLLNLGLNDYLRDIIGDEAIANTVMSGSFENGVRTSKYGIGDLLSMNDFVSGKLAANATGDVIIFNADFKPDKVLAQT